MKALIWKELREMAGWAALIAIGLLVAEAYMLFTELGYGSAVRSGHSAGAVDAAIDSAYGYFKIGFQIGAPIGALFLGAMQIFPELRRDQWSFLLHRPATRRAILFAKIIAGVGLYLAATLVPLLLITFWLQVPGHFPGPFRTALAEPDIASILAGISLYFAAMIVALRPARWWGSKLLPLVGSATCALVSCTLLTFAEAIALAIVAALVTFLGTCGCFETKGEYDGMGFAQRSALGILLLTSVPKSSSSARLV